MLHCHVEDLLMDLCVDFLNGLGVPFCVNMDRHKQWGSFFKTLRTL